MCFYNFKSILNYFGISCNSFIIFTFLIILFLYFKIYIFILVYFNDSIFIEIK